MCGKRLKCFLLALLLLLLPLAASYSEEKIWYTQAEVEQMERDWETVQTELNELKMQLKTVCQSYEQERKEQRKKTIEVGIVTFSAGVVIGSVIYAILD